MSPLPPLSALTFRDRYFLEFASRDVAQHGCTVRTIHGAEFEISSGLHADLISGVLADYVRHGLMAAAAPAQPDQLEDEHV